MNRRTLLLSALAGPVACSATFPDAPRRLTTAQVATLAALAEVATGGPGLPTASDLAVAGRIDDLMANCDPALVADVGLALDLLASPWVGLVVTGRPGAFVDLARDARMEVVGHWRRHRVGRVRGAMQALLGLCLATYWGDRRTFAYVGYPGPMGAPA